jgi:hypothetical protein
MRGEHYAPLLLLLLPPLLLLLLPLYFPGSR